MVDAPKMTKASSWCTLAKLETKLMLQELWMATTSFWFQVRAPMYTKLRKRKAGPSYEVHPQVLLDWSTEAEANHNWAARDWIRRQHVSAEAQPSTMQTRPK